MAIRLTIEGIHVECDTPQEVATLIRATKSGDKYPQQPHISSHGRHDSKVDLFNSDQDIMGMRGNYREILIAMKEVYPSSVSSESIASRISKTLRSLPIILVGIQTHVKKMNLIFEELVVRTEAPRGEKGSSYRLTEKGLKVFFG